MSPVRAAVFDLGGVLLAYDYRIWAERVAPHCQGGAEPLALIGEYGHARDAERGYLDLDHFHAWLVAQAGLSLSLAEFTHAWSDIFERKPEMMRLVSELQVERKLALSNTNPAHVRWITDRYPDVLALFDRVYLSCELHLLKPDPAIYHAVAADSHLAPGEHLFVDDRLENVLGAQEAGWQAVHFTGYPALRKALGPLLGR